MTAPKALLTFGIGPVHEFIASARRVADVWAGSDLLSHLMGEAIKVGKDAGAKPVYPAGEPSETPTGIPNRVVLRAPLARVEEIAETMGKAVEARWTALAEEAVEFLRDYGIHPAGRIWPADPDSAHPRQTDRVFDIAWSWVPENGDYATASREGAVRYAASRLFRPFEQVEQQREKCALCGIRTALPNGDRAKVRSAWEEAEAEALQREERGEGHGDFRFLRFDQGRLCLVCATKRLYTREEKKVYFQALDTFGRSAAGEPDKPKARDGKAGETGESRDDRRRYVAVVAMDGDKMSEILALGAGDVVDGKVEEFHDAVSRALGDFARELRRRRVKQGRDGLENAQLDLKLLGIDSQAPVKNRPQLLYAGGDDVLVVCAPADALPVAWEIRRRFLSRVKPLREHLENRGDLDRLTLSGAIVYAHSKHPAGALFHEANDLLKRKAKGEARRNALALRLMKRSGVPVEVAFKWTPVEDAPNRPDGVDWLALFDGLVTRLRERTLSSTQSFDLRREERVLTKVFGEDSDRWIPWLADRLSRGEATSQEAQELAELIAPFFARGKTEALRIARFLGVEVKASEANAEEAGS